MDEEKEEVSTGGGSVDVITNEEFKKLMSIRTITCFVTLPTLISNDDDTTLNKAIAAAARFLHFAQQAFTEAGYTVQTTRIATNPFGEWLLPCTNNNNTKDDYSKDTTIKAQLKRLDSLLAQHQVEFCALGPATTQEEVRNVVPLIVGTSHRLSCSADLTSACNNNNIISMAKVCASTVQAIANLNHGNHVQNGLGNFRFAVAANCKDHIPFFPVAKSSSSLLSSGILDISTCSRVGTLSFAIGLENGELANRVLAQCGSIQHIHTAFKATIYRAMVPIQFIAKQIEHDAGMSFRYLGIDTSLNPSLSETGSIARAVEQLNEVAVFGGPGSLAAAAAITASLQSLEGILCTGYCGLMLPVCEDSRLVQLVSSSKNEEGKGERTLRIADLLSISSVCGVGIDTVPIANDCKEETLAALFLDVAGLATRWNKSLSCRVLPMPGKKVGDMTTFDSPYMMNAKIMSLM